MPESGDNLDPTTKNHQWNGDPLDWESWPTGRPGPIVPESRIQETLGVFQFYEQFRDDRSRTEEKVFHVAEFSATGQGECDLSQLV